MVCSIPENKSKRPSVTRSSRYVRKEYLCFFSPTWYFCVFLLNFFKFSHFLVCVCTIFVIIFLNFSFWLIFSLSHFSLGSFAKTVYRYFELQYSSSQITIFLKSFVLVLVEWPRFWHSCAMFPLALPSCRWTEHPNVKSLARFQVVVSQVLSSVSSICPRLNRLSVLSCSFSFWLATFLKTKLHFIFQTIISDYSILKNAHS